MKKRRLPHGAGIFIAIPVGVLVWAVVIYFAFFN